MLLMRQIDRWRRLILTGFFYCTFGIGGLFLGVLVMPLLHLISSDRQTAQTRCQACIHYSFRIFIWQLRVSGVLTYTISGIEKLNAFRGRVVVANHPSLIDTVLIVALIPNALCIVKKAVWYNPFMAGIVRGAGYLPNHDAEMFMEACADAFKNGKTLVVFPEGTRTVPRQPIRLRRGAAAIIAAFQVPVTPICITTQFTLLSKGQPWYDVSATRPHIMLNIQDVIDFSDIINDASNSNQAHRNINKAIKRVFENGIRRDQGITGRT